MLFRAAQNLQDWVTVNKIETAIIRVLVMPVILYAYETWPTSKEDEKKLAVLERKFLRRIFASNKNGQYEIRWNNEIKELLVVKKI